MAGMHARARRWPRAGKLVVLGLVAGLAGCSDDLSSPAGPPDPGRDPRPDGDATDTSVPPLVQRVELDFEVNGAFRPGVPIAITAVARGRRQADDMTLELLVHDEPTPAGTPPEQGGRRRIGTLQGGVGRGAERRLGGTVTFASPGFYRVSAHAVTSGPTPPVAQGDSLIADVSDETLYILVDENGGRRLDRHDAQAFAGRLPMFGSYGPFIPGARMPGVRTASASLSPTDGPSRQTSTAYTYWIEYDNDEVGAKRPVAGATAEIKCLDTNFAPVGNPIYPTVNADGSFSFTCPYGYFDGSVLLRDWYSDVVKEDRTTGGVSYFNEYDTNRRLVAASKQAAHVFVLLRTYVPVVEQRFGRWRARLPVWVSDTAGAKYLPTKDTVVTNINRVFREDGRFVTMHEYGHAYQYKAIEVWSQSTACPVHYTHLPSHRECAFPEGFATFLAVWVAGNEMANTGTNGDYGIETQTFYTNGDGINIEGSVAGFLYDLVDGSGQRDNSTNTGATEETWDTAVFPGSFIADVMASCALYQASTGAYTYYLSGADQLVYCLEGNVSAEGYTSYWRTTWDSLTRTATLPAGYSSTLVRTLWRRNLYGVP
jgi:hypothetical protein